MIKAITITWFLNLIKNWFIVLLRTVKEKELEKKKIIVKYDLSSSIYFTSMQQVIIAFLQFLMIDVIPERYPICIKQTKIWTYIQCKPVNISLVKLFLPVVAAFVFFLCWRHNRKAMKVFPWFLIGFLWFQWFLMVFLEDKPSFRLHFLWNLWCYSPWELSVYILCITEKNLHDVNAHFFISSDDLCLHQFYSILKAEW